ncbi:MAG: universal stress protein [Sulfuritalea sp.]|nr:universal stress protein [Sulfuritalea sp.]
MGRHGRSALTHLLLGSVVSDVSRKAGVPVILVKQGRLPFVSGKPGDLPGFSFVSWKSLIK